ncbi:chemotaxis protein [Photobacterium leiognathi]|uniref:Chemotaxis protein n=2 Tax=Photobacterium leiognathi TaxID=553611 RepID=A0ABX5GFT7_PHOLE|nr:chemotaxis protein [Photobacterium leiognathi]PSV82209.1 chemotaxis protein [Photobacterium leiognathi]
MYDHLAFISGDWVTDAIILTTAAVFLFFSFRELVAVIKTKIQLKGLGKIKLKASSNILDSKSLKKDQLVWVTDHLVYTPTQDGIAVETKGDLWLTKSPISQMLPTIDSSRYKLIPALLTSIGITGTFLGITLGLSEFTMAGDSKALLASAAELLEGMKTAFYTSLAGLGTSALFMVWMKISSSVLAKAQKQLISTLSSQYFEASPIYYLKNMSNEGQKEVLEAQLRTASAVELMDEKMEATSHVLAQLGTSFNGEVIAKQISTALVESIETSMSPMLRDIKQELGALKDIKEQSQKELVELLIQEMKSELIAPVAEELSKTSAAVTSSNEVTSQLNSNIERVVTSTSETVDTINEFQKETMLKLQSFAESLKGILASFKEDTQGAMTSIASEVNTMLNNASQGMDSQRVAFEQSANKAASAFEGMKNSLEVALDERQSAEKVLFENVTGRINGLLSEISTSFENQTSVLAQTGETASNLMNQAQKDFEVSVQIRRDEESHLFGEMEGRINGLVQNSQVIFQEQAEAIKLVGDEASSVMQSAKSELQQGLGDIDSKVKSMSATVQSELETFREQYQQNLTSYFEQQNNLLEGSLSKQRDGLNDVVDNFRKVFESEYQARHNLLQELTAQYQKLEASAQTVERVAKAIGLNEASKMAELQDAAHTMSREIALLKKEYAKASATFTDITENLPKAMDEYFTRANESFETFFNDFDQSASSIHNKLSQAAGYLINSQVLRREFEADEVKA